MRCASATPTHPKTRHLVSGVVAGIGGYGNCMGIPTVGGETNFHASYNGNILVNAMTVGIAPSDRIFYAAAAGVGNPLVYVGSKTGRDGIHGATMASTEFSEDSEEKRPTVQVGDPFVEKLLLEACLELMATDAIVAIQDMGAAGLTSSSFEMAAKGGLGVVVELDKVPMRETGMNPYELMLSESQERMLIVLKPGREALARKIFEKWELDFAVIGHLTDTERMVLSWHGDIVGNIPIPPLVTEAPVYERPWTLTPLPAVLDAAKVPAPKDWRASLLTLMSCPDLASKAWIWHQYDHLIMGNTAIRPQDGDAALVRVNGGHKGLAMTSDCTPRYVQAHPETGGRQAVAEAWRNITAVGATPLAVTDNMNFGNPQKPEIMGQFAGAIMGMAEACKALDFPVVSGNVSLYNETEGKPILPTPTIGAVGVIEDIANAIGSRITQAGLAIVLLGETTGWLGQSLYLRETQGREEGAPPPVDLVVERRNGDFVRGEIVGRRISACHDLSDGGLLVGLAEMCLAGGTGVTVKLPARHRPAACLPLWRGPGPLPGGDRRWRRAPGRGPGGRRAGRATRLFGRPRPQRRRPAVDGAQRPQGGPRSVAARLHEQRRLGGKHTMPMAAQDIIRLIKEGIPGAEVEIEDMVGDGDHYAATVISPAFAGKSKVQQHQMVYGALGGRMGGVLHALKLTTMAQRP